MLRKVRKRGTRMKACLELGNWLDKGRRGRSKEEGEVQDFTEELSPGDWLGETELSGKKEVRKRSLCIYMVEVKREVMDLGERLTNVSPRIPSSGANGPVLAVDQTLISWLSSSPEVWAFLFCCSSVDAFPKTSETCLFCAPWTLNIPPSQHLVPLVLKLLSMCLGLPS